MLSSTRSLARRLRSAPRSAPLLAALVFCFAFATPLTAVGCELWINRDDGKAALVTSSQLPEAIVSGTLRCGTDVRPVTIWTLGVDADAAHLGIRDEPLFRTEFTGPLRQVAEADMPGAARISVHLRASAATRILADGAQARTHRRFATFCDAALQPFAPLNCSLHGARVKARATAHDADLDGELDVVKHEISFYRRDRLHVVTFLEGYRPSALAGASTWIEVLTVLGALPPDV